MDSAEGALGEEGVWGKGRGDLGYDRDVEEFGQTGAVGGYVFVLIWVVLVDWFAWSGGEGWVDGRRTFDVDGWRVAAGLHDAAEEDGDVAGHQFCQLVTSFLATG